MKFKPEVTFLAKNINFTYNKLFMNYKAASLILIALWIIELFLLAPPTVWIHPDPKNNAAKIIVALTGVMVGLYLYRRFKAENIK